jgi:hypothetical protein
MADCVLQLLVAEAVKHSKNTERQGYATGYRFVEQICDKRLGADALDVMKFVCKELWFGVFGKQIDKLQTNHRGTFVLKDFQFRWLSRVSCGAEDEKNEYTARLLLFACGVVRGALANLGVVVAQVTASAAYPACSFSVQLQG